MTRALTLQDIINQLNQSSANSINLSSTEVLNELISDFEGCQIAETFLNFPTAYRPVPYDVNIIQDACPVGYWRLNDYFSLLSFDDSTLENTIGSWTSVTSAVARSTTQHKDGTHSLQVTSTGAGGGATTGFYTVIPSTVYVGFTWVFSTVAARNFNITITWYTAGKTSISTQTSPSTAGTLNAWTQIIFAANAPSNAAYMKMQVNGINQANTNVYYIDVSNFIQFGYDSNSLGITPGFKKNSASSIDITSQILPGITGGPRNNPDSSQYPSCAQFTTTGDQLSIATAPQLELTRDVSLELWAYVSGQLSGSHATIYGLLSKGYAEYGLDLYGDGALGFSFTGTSALVSAASAVPTADGQWHHIVATKSSSTRTLTIYVDGVSKATGTYASDPASSSNAVTIGKSSAHNGLANAYLEEVAIYGRALSPTQVAFHYAVGTSAGSVESGWGLSFDGGSTNKYGQYGYAQYPSFVPPGPVYDGGAVYGTFTWG